MSIEAYQSNEFVDIIKGKFIDLPVFAYLRTKLLINDSVNLVDNNIELINKSDQIVENKQYEQIVLEKDAVYPVKEIYNQKVSDNEHQKNKFTTKKRENLKIAFNRKGSFRETKNRNNHFLENIAMKKTENITVNIKENKNDFYNRIQVKEDKKSTQAHKRIQDYNSKKFVFKNLTNVNVDSCSLGFSTQNKPISENEDKKQTKDISVELLNNSKNLDNSSTIKDDDKQNKFYDNEKNADKRSDKVKTLINRKNNKKMTLINAPFCQKTKSNVRSIIKIEDIKQKKDIVKNKSK